MLQDNLDDQVQKQYQYMCPEGDTTLYWYYHPDNTYGLDPPDTSAGNQIRFWFMVYLYEKLRDYVNVEIWYLGLFHYPH